MVTYVSRAKRLAVPVKVRSRYLRIYPVFALAVVTLGCATYESASRDVSQTLETWHRRSVQLDGDGALNGMPAPNEPSNTSATIMAQDQPNSPLHGYILEALEVNFRTFSQELNWANWPIRTLL